MPLVNETTQDAHLKTPATDDGIQEEGIYIVYVYTSITLLFTEERYTKRVWDPARNQIQKLANT